MTKTCCSGSRKKVRVQSRATDSYSFQKFNSIYEKITQVEGKKIRDLDLLRY